MNEKRIAITGASGLIGTALTEKLASHSTDMLILRRPDTQFITPPDRRPHKDQTTISSQHPLTIDWHPTTGVTHVHQLENLDAFIHLAGRSINAARWTTAEKSRLRDSRVLATQRLVAQLSTLEHKPQVFLSASAVGIYGDCGDRWVAESDRAADDFLGKLALDWEEAARPLEALGVRVIHMRLGVVLSPRGGALAKLIPLFRFGLGGKLGSGRQFMSWISLNDCVSAIELLLSHGGASGPVNVVSPQPVTNEQFTRALGMALHRPTILPAPKFALRLALGEMADGLLLSGCRASSQKLQELGFEFQYPDVGCYLADVL